MSSKNLNNIINNEMYQKLKKDITEKTDFRDATYYLRNDGTFIFAEGYYHQQDLPFNQRHIISHIVYAPHSGSSDIPEYANKKLFGQKYENITKKIMTENSVEKFYPLQLKRYHKIDPSLTTEKPIFAKYKAMVPVKSLVSAFPGIETLDSICALADIDPAADKINTITKAMSNLLEIPTTQIGISGSVSLGAYNNPHDLDYVIHGSIKEIRRITDYIYDLTSKSEERKVYEFGKFWPLRYYEQVKNDKFMVCPFFSYTIENEIPLLNFTCHNPVKASVEGIICDHTHNCFNPSILMLEKVKINNQIYKEPLRLIIYHGGARGDYIEGMKVKVQADLVEIVRYKNVQESKIKIDEFKAVLVTNFDQFKL
jgi:predicted nucleotidyltransferase